MKRCRLVLLPLLAGAIVLAISGSALAWQSSKPTLVVPPPSNTQFQQTVQQQQLRDQLQKSQLQQQLHQSVSDMAKRPGSNAPGLQKQLRQADRAQDARDRAAQQDLIDRYQGQAALPHAVPQPATASSSH